MLNNYINYTFIKTKNLHSFDVITIHHHMTSIYKHNLKRPKILKRDTLWGCYFSFGSTNILSLYIRITKLSLLGCYFLFESN